MSKKILFITTKVINDIDKDGIAKKIYNQKMAWEKLGFNVDFFYRTNNGIQGNIDNKIVKYKGFFLPRFFMLIWCFYILKKESYEILYLRNIHTEMNVLGLPVFFLLIKKIVKKIVIEIPTFPYFDEVKGFKNSIYLFLYKLNIPILRKKIDLITFMGRNQSSIWGVPALRIVNCVNIENIVYKTHNRNNDGVLKFIGVAGLAYWHGYDRLIHGMSLYKKNKIEFHIVGNNEPEYSKLKNIAEKFDQVENVIFHGELNTSQMNKIFEKMDIAVDSLGRHRSGLDYNCSIKSKEYAARNIPFIKSHDDDSFENVDFVYNVPANDSPIEIDEVIKWFSKLSFADKDYIRKYAAENFIWEQQFKLVLNRLKG
jgi:hypothetical protein